MKNETVAALVAVLVIVLGIQAYMTFRLNDRLNQLSMQGDLAVSPQIKIPKLSKSIPPKSVNFNGY